ncbi:MAG: tetratricopeptide repeat protein [Elainellaceae cyanobacterium]
MGTISPNNRAIAQSTEPAPILELEDEDFWTEQCQTLGQSRQYEDALAACDQAIALNDDIDETVPVWTTRGEALVYLGRYEEALISLSRVLEEHPQHSLAMTYQCVAQYNLSQYEVAVDTCETALLADGNWGTRSPAYAWYYRGLSLRQQGFLETALGSFERAIRSNGATDDRGSPAAAETPLAQAEWCHTLHLLGEGAAIASSSLEPCGLEEAIALYEQALLADPQDLVLWQQQGFALEQQGLYERALMAYNQALTISADHPSTLSRRCGTLNQLERYEDALAACEAALDTMQPEAPHEMAYRLNQHSVALLGLERYEAALASAERAIAVAVDYAPAHNSRAVSLWRLDQPFSAEAAVEQALKHYALQVEQFEDTFYRPSSDPWPLFYRDYGLAWFNQGQILHSQNREPHSAAYAYHQAIGIPTQKQPRSANSTFWCINPPEIWRVDDQVQQVSARQTLPVLPYNRLTDTLLNLSALYLDCDPSRAYALSAMMTQLEPESFMAWYNLGLAALTSGQMSEAYYAFSIAHRMEPENIQVLMGAAAALAQQGKTDEAIAAYEQVLAIDPTYLPAEERLNALIGVGNEETGQ